MREILFRGRLLDSDEWVEGYYVRLFDDKGNISHRIYPGFAETDCGDFYPDWFEVDPVTVGQYIRLEDKNGNRVFEGDIIRSTHGLKWLVDFEYNAFVCKDSSMETYFALWEQWKYDWESKKEIPPDDIFEVIGNIHDNPKLMEAFT